MNDKTMILDLGDGQHESVHRLYLELKHIGADADLIDWLSAHWPAEVLAEDWVASELKRAGYVAVRLPTPSGRVRVVRLDDWASLEQIVCEALD